MPDTFYPTVLLSQKGKELKASMRKYLHSSNRLKLNIPICAAAVLFCLTLFSTYFVSGLYARYTSSKQSVNDARVAVFSVKGGGELTKPIVAKLVPGETSEHTLIITNNSEVAVDYTITVTKETNNLPLEFRLTDSDPDNPEVLSGWSPDGCTCTVKQIPGSHNDRYILHIKWTANEDKDKDLALAGMVDHITVTVTATQAD